MLKHGMVDMVVSRRDLRETVARLLSLLFPPASIQQTQLPV
jgi:acetyl-CoA carboxylase beta subunit